jgi:type I restriction enzyme M protein
MSADNHSQIASFIWGICNLLRGPYKRNEYRKVILPLTVLRRFDCILAPTKAEVLKEHSAIKTKGENIIRNRLSQITGTPFYNLSKFTMGPACGTGGMLSVAEKYIHDLNADAQPKLFGQDWNDEAWAVCKSDMLIKGEDADNIIMGDTFIKDGFDRMPDGKKWMFDYMLANPPFGVEWKQQQKYIENEKDTLGFAGRFGAGTPRVNDGALLFLQHMISKMRPPQDGGSRVAIVFNGSPLFTGDAGSGESNIRQWIIDARQFWVQMEKSLGNKRRRIGDPSDKERDPDHIGELTKIFGDFRDGQTRKFTEEDPVTHQPIERERVVSKIFDNEDFGYSKITVELPLRRNFQATAERIARLDDESGFKNLATSAKKDPAIRQQEIEAGQQRQEEIRELVRAFAKSSKEKLFKDRKEFLTENGNC